jgi:hypothetical protein
MTENQMHQHGTFEPGTVRFLPCVEFAGSPHDPLVCSCGWLAQDHAPPQPRATVTPLRRRRPQVTLPDRRAS